MVVSATERAENRRRTAAIALAVVLATAGWSTIAIRESSLYPKRFAAVAEGRLYRSGELTPAQLERVVREHRVRTVLSLLDPNVPRSRAEKAAAERLGVRWINVPLTGDGASDSAQREQLKSVLLDASNEPILVHCAAGSNRTGLAAGLYRLHRDGWTLDAVLDEMRRFGFKDKPHHENLRQALAVEAEAARATHAADASPR